MATRIADDNITPIASAEIITDLDPAVGLTVPAGANQALIQCTGQAVRYFDDGTTPTASTGIQLAIGEKLWYTGDLSAITFFEEGTASILTILYYTVL